MSLVNGNSRGYKDLAKSPNPNNPIFFSDNNARRYGCRKIST